MTTALIVVDIQNDYFPGGKMELQGSPEASLQAHLLLEHFRQAGLPCLHVQHIAVRPGATFFLPGSPGVQIHPNVLPMAEEPVITKHYPNSFRETTLLAELQSRQVTRLVIAGMMTHMCVDATVRAGYDLGYDCLLAADACATRDLNFSGRLVVAADVHHAFLAALNGTYAKVLNTDKILSGSLFA